MERLLEEISFTASDRPSTAVEIEGADVRDLVGEIARKVDPGKFVFQHFLPFADSAKGRWPHIARPDETRQPSPSSLDPRIADARAKQKLTHPDAV
jgi:hypothetical protein